MQEGICFWISIESLFLIRGFTLSFNCGFLHNQSYIQKRITISFDKFVPQISFHAGRYTYIHLETRKETFFPDYFQEPFYLHADDDIPSCLK